MYALPEHPQVPIVSQLQNLSVDQFSSPNCPLFQRTNFSKAKQLSNLV